LAEQWGKIHFDGAHFRRDIAAITDFQSVLIGPPTLILCFKQ
jgi:hypothetical protein